MATEAENGRLSDTEGGEKPVREQLKKAHIHNDPNAPQSDATEVEQPAEHENGDTEGAAGRGRLQRKRSFEEVEGSSQDMTPGPPRQHARKRSRDSTAEEDELNNGQRKVSGERARNGDESTQHDMDTTETNGTSAPPRAATPELASEQKAESSIETLSSPKTKRSRLHSATVDDEATLKDDKVAAEKSSKAEDTPATSARAETTAKVPPGSGFANTSAASPFGALAGSKSPTPQTSASAFAGSGFASSSSSGFGAVGKSSGGFGSGGSFASGAKSPTSENQNPASLPSSSFGGTLGQKSAFAAPGTSSSGFGSGASGFGSLGSKTSGGFGSGIGGTGFSSLGSGGLTSFASGKSTPLGKPAKAFGSSADEDEEADGAEDEDDDKAGAKSPLATEEEKQDERFYEQDLETGEEDEITHFSGRAKLYNFASVADGKKEWRERGLGVLRFNVKASGDGTNPAGRLLMRADGSHRVVLNTPVKKEIKFGAPSGGPPEGGYIYFMGTFADSEKGGLELLQLKMKQVNALDLHQQIVDLQAKL